MRPSACKAAISFVVLLAGGGCAADFSAVLHVTIDGPALSPGAGYQIELRRPDGAALEGIESLFVAFKPGDQDVTLILERDDLFQGSDTFVARLLVEALPGENIVAMARGSSLVNLKRGEVVEVVLSLLDDPRPLAMTMTATFDPGAATFGDERITFNLAALPGALPYEYHLWLEGSDGSLSWVGALDAGAGSEVFDPRTHGAIVGDAGLVAVVTAEPTDSPSSLVRSSGWQVLRGEMPPGLAATLLVAPPGVAPAPLGYVAAMLDLIGIAEQHVGLSLVSFDAGNTTSVRSHAEHVFGVVAGQAVADAGGPLGDLTGDGTVGYVASDHTGLGRGDAAGGQPGYLHLVNEIVGRLESAGLNIATLEGCLTAFGNAATGTLAAAIALALAPTDAAVAIDFDCQAKSLRGDVTVLPRGACTVPEAMVCVRAELETMGDFSLAPVAAGAN